MASLNRWVGIGRLGRDPEVKYTPSGVAVCNFSVATSETWKDKQTGERKEKTEWHRISCYRKLAEICGQYLKKGREAYIEGKLQTRSWDQDGVKRYITEIIADEVIFLGGQTQTQEKPYTVTPDDDNSDIPF